MSIRLPDLAQYRSAFIKKGIKFPLPATKQAGCDLFNLLPAPSAKNDTAWPWADSTNPKIYDAHKVWPKITIVTPSYNQGHFIEQTIRSVLLQNYPNLEYIIIDGGSTDNTKSILEKYSPWLSYWKSEKDNGQSHAINQGFSLASGDYLAWINSDDYYLKDVFFKVISAFIKTDASFIYGYGLNYLIDETRFELVKVPPLLDYFLRLPSLVQPSTFWGKNIHQPLWEALHCSLDYELWQRMLKGIKKSLIKQPLSCTNIHMEAKTHDPKMADKWNNDHLLICDGEAHGPVNNWNKKIFLYKIYNRINKIFNVY